MPDLTTGDFNYIASNYRRAENKFSNFGTRRLRFYTIEVDGFDAYNDETNTEENDWNFGTTDSDMINYSDDYYYAYKNVPKSLVESVLRGVALVAEIYYVSWWYVEYENDYPYFYVTVAVAGDTFLDAQNQLPSSNPHSIGLADAVANALGDEHYWDSVYAWPVEISGRHLNQVNDQYALQQMTREKVQVTDADKAERTARLAHPKLQKVTRNK